MNKFMTTLFASLLLTAAGSAMAGDYGDQGQRGKHHQRGSQDSMMVEQFARELRYLDLSDEQKASVKATMQNLRTQSKSMASDFRDNQTQLRDVIKADIWNEEAAARLAAREGDLTAQRTLLNSKAMAGIYAQLTVQQRAELDAKAEERRERRTEWRETRQERQNKTE